MTSGFKKALKTTVKIFIRSFMLCVTAMIVETPVQTRDKSDILSWYIVSGRIRLATEKDKIQIRT